MLPPNPRPVRENAMAQKAQRDRLKANLATMDWESNANGQANVQGTGAEITIRGLAGPYTVVGSNFAPGTTAADIEAAMLPIGGQMHNCQVSSFPSHSTPIPLDFHWSCPWQARYPRPRLTPVEVGCHDKPWDEMNPELRPIHTHKTPLLVEYPAC